MTDLQKAAQRVVKAMGEGQATLTRLGVELLTLQKENARLREALTGLYQALRERHHGRMPDDVRVAYEQAAAALAGEERDLAAENRAAIAEQEHGRRNR